MVQTNSLKNFAIVICGATATGKSGLAVELAKRLDTQIISADSIAIYKGLNIGAAKPSEKERSEVVHHMVDIASPFDEWTVSDYKKIALPIIYNLFEKGKIPIICGGTGYYIKSLLYKFSYGNCEKNDEIRNKYNLLAKEKGANFVYELLKKVDEKTANKLHPNDLMRVVRALEIYELSGQKKSEIVDETIPNFPYFAFSIDYDREELYKRINLRVDNMFTLGLENEVNSLKSLGLTINNQSMQGIGYKEFFEFDNINEIKENIKLNTRHYAKRQITYFKKLENTFALKPYTSNMADKVLEIIDNEIYR